MVTSKLKRPYVCMISHDLMGSVIENVYKSAMYSKLFRNRIKEKRKESIESTSNLTSLYPSTAIKACRPSYTKNYQWRIQDFPNGGGGRGANPWVWTENLFIITVHNSSCGKVMFSQASVNLFMRVGLGIGGVGYPGGKGYQRVGYSPPPKKNKQQKRSVRILLEYFLVWQDFLQKTAWKWKKLDREEVARDPSAPPPPPDLPMLMVYPHCTEWE